MDIKKIVLDQVSKLLQNPRVLEVAMNPKVMGVVMKAMSLREQVVAASASASESVARTLNLATREEVGELRRTVRRLEEQLSQLEVAHSDGEE